MPEKLLESVWTVLAGTSQVGRTGRTYPMRGAPCSSGHRSRQLPGGGSGRTLALQAFGAHTARFGGLPWVGEAVRGVSLLGEGQAQGRGWSRPGPDSWTAVPSFPPPPVLSAAVAQVHMMPTPDAGAALFTCRPRLAGLFGETCNFVVSRARARAGKTSLMASSSHLLLSVASLEEAWAG